MGGWDYYCFLCAAGFYNPYSPELGDQESEDEPDGKDELSGSRKIHRFSREELADRLRWLTIFRAIGQNRNATGLTQCYLSGPAEEDEFGQANIQRGEHPNAQNIPHDYVTCYRDGEQENGDLPVHDSCFDILCAVFAEAQGAKSNWIREKSTTSIPFNLDALFSCLAAVRGDYDNYLHLDHGLQPDQYFYVDQDRIYDYFDPLEGLAAQTSVEGIVDLHPTEIASEHHTSNVFDTLPEELLTHILDLTTQADLLSLIKAASSFRRTTNRNNFWKHRLLVDAPWLWECHANETISNIKWQRYYNSIMMQAYKPFHMAARGVRITGLANRRRIWHVCKQVLDLYLLKNKLGYREERKSIFENGVICQYLPIVASQQQQQYISESAFFFNDNSEMHLAKRLRLKWLQNGALCAMSLTTEAREVTFGEEGNFEYSESVIDIRHDDWIQKLVLNISVSDNWESTTPNEKKTHAGLAVTGVAIWHFFDTVTVIRRNKGYKRLLEPLPGNGIIGLKTQAAGGIITHLGILEHPAGLIKYQPIHHSSSVSKLLWNDCIPPADLRFKDYMTGYWMSGSAWDLIPMHELPFGSTDIEQATIIGFGTTLDLRGFEIYRSDGSCKRVGLQSEPTKVFHIDGPGGERILGFEVTTGALPVGVTLVTSNNRQAVFGRRSDNAKAMCTSEHGFGIAGLYCSFGYDSVRKNQLSSIGLIQSPHIERRPIAKEQMATDASGLLWEPQPPAHSWSAFGQIYGSKHQGEVAMCFNFSRPVVKIDGLFPAPEWLATIEIGGFTMSYGDSSLQEPVSYFGFPPRQWPTGEYSTPENLRSMSRYIDMSMTLGRRATYAGKAHALTDEEALNQPTTWHLGEYGERITAVSVWADEYLNGLQFHSQSGKDSPRWGKCGGQPSGTIRAGGTEGIVGLKIILGSMRLNHCAKALSPQAVQAMSDAQH